MDGILFAHNGMIQDLEALEAEIGHVTCASYGGTPTPSATSRSSRRRSASTWPASAPGSRRRSVDRPGTFPLYSINFVLAYGRRALGLSLPGDASALRARARGRRWLTVERSAPRERDVAGARSGPAPLPLVVVWRASRWTTPPGWRPLESGELVRVKPDLSIRSSIVVDSPPAKLIRLPGSTGERASLGPSRS